jgi:hypothetical protein
MHSSTCSNHSSKQQGAAVTCLLQVARFDEHVTCVMHTLRCLLALQVTCDAHL